MQKSQDNQIIRLRVKYNTAILTSHLNEKRNEVLIEGQRLFNGAAQQRLFHIVAESSTAKMKTAQSGNTKKKTNSPTTKKVTFAANLASSFEEARD